MRRLVGWVAGSSKARVAGAATLAAGGILAVIGVFGVSAASVDKTRYGVSFDSNLASCRGTGGVPPLTIDPETGLQVHCTDTGDSGQTFTDPEQEQILGLAGDLADDGSFDDGDQTRVAGLAAGLAARHGFDRARSDRTIAGFGHVMVVGFALMGLGILTMIVAPRFGRGR